MVSQSVVPVARLNKEYITAAQQQYHSTAFYTAWYSRAAYAGKLSLDAISIYNFLAPEPQAALPQKTVKRKNFMARLVTAVGQTLYFSAQLVTAQLVSKLATPYLQKFQEKIPVVTTSSWFLMRELPGTVMVPQGLASFVRDLQLIDNGLQELVAGKDAQTVPYEAVINSLIAPFERVMGHIRYTIDGLRKSDVYGALLAEKIMQKAEQLVEEFCRDIDELLAQNAGPVLAERVYSFKNAWQEQLLFLRALPCYHGERL